MKLSHVFAPTAAFCLTLAAASFATAGEESLRSPDSRINVIVSDVDGLHYRVSMDGQPVLADSRLGLDFNGGFSLGRATKILTATSAERDETWENHFGRRRMISDHYRELKLTLRESADAPNQFNLFVRAYDNGIALRYEIPRQPGLETFIVTDERTEFVFPSDLKCCKRDSPG